MRRVKAKPDAAGVTTCPRALVYGSRRLACSDAQPTPRAPPCCCLTHAMAAARIAKICQQLSPRAQLLSSTAAASAPATTPPARRLRVAAICSTWNPLQHADVIVTKFLKGISTDDGFHAPEVDVVSIWIDCVLEQDIGLHLARQHNVPVFSTIKQAMECGTGRLSVDAVLLVGEHGD
jgi:hypothetical protein